jgi:peptidoglycan/xylan/chitin deacetylase (PgdA/CDA1 family)
MAPLKRAAQGLFHWAGGVQAVRFLNRGGIRILMYHRFGEPDPKRLQQIEAQCAHLQRNYRVVSLTEACQRLAEAGPLPPNLLAITVDDGHRDFYTTAYPIFERHGLPATLFLTTDYVDGKCWLWFDLVDYLFEATSRESVEALGRIFSLRTAGEKQAAADVLKNAALELDHQARRELMQQLPDCLQVSVPAHTPERWAPLAWEEAREMAAHGIEFGAHTRTHPILADLTTAEALREEIEGSKARVEEMLGTPVRHFCYPNGSLADFTNAVVECVRRAGYQSAVTTESGINAPGESPFLLKRIGADPWHDRRYFMRRVAGGLA